MSIIRILIVRHDAAASANLPAQFCHGVGWEGALFHVLGFAKPHSRDVHAALAHWNDCVNLTRYHAGCGVGYFQVIEDFAPAVGEVLNLAIPDNARERENERILFERRPQA